MRPDPFAGFNLGFNLANQQAFLYAGLTRSLFGAIIAGNYLDTAYDRDLMIKGVRLMRKIAGTPAMKEMIEREISPGSPCESDERILNCQSRQLAVFINVALADGPRPKQSVVDPRLRVHGIQGLRV